MIKFKVDVVKELKEAGYNSTRIRKENLLPQSTLSYLRQGKDINFSSLDTICRLLKCQPGMLLEYVPDEEAYSIDGGKKKL